MKRLRFEGHSDDTFGEYESLRDDFDNCGSGKPIEWLVSSDEGSLVVVGQYRPGGAGGWLVGVSPADYDDIPIPPWSIVIMPGRIDYSPTLVIEAPDDVTIRCLQREADS